MSSSDQIDIRAILSVGSAKLSVSRLDVPGTDIQASTVAGEMEMPSGKRLIAIGTALERDGAELEASAAVRYLVIDAGSCAVVRNGRHVRNFPGRRRNR